MPFLTDENRFSPTSLVSYLMPEIASYRRSATVSILTILTAAVCLLAFFGGIDIRKAYAGSTENIAFSVPAKVPFAVKADGTVVGPSASAWRIVNEGGRPLRMKDVTASGFDDGSTVSTVSEAMPVAGTSARGIWSINASRGGASLTASVDGTIEIPVGDSVGFTWNANTSDDTKHAVGPTPMALGMVSLTLGGADHVAFAVYSADDGTLNFYKRMDVPEVGDTFDGKTVTEVYTDFENKHYVFETEGSNHVPWFDIRKKVKSVQVVDDGIQPYYTHAWFAQMESLTDCDITKLDTSHTTVFYDMFNGCTSLESLDLTHMDTSSAIYMGYMLKNCSQLKTVDVSSFDTSKCQDLSIFFSGDSSLTEIKGLGNWDTSSCRWMTLMFNGCSSLTQIRGLENWDVHSVEIMDSMFEQCQKLQNVDISHFEGKSLKSTEAMFFHCYSLTTVDVSKLVTGTCTDIGCMFDGCTGLTSIQGLDKWDVSNIKDCHQAFYYCCSLPKIDLANWKFSPSGTIQAMFYHCSPLKELNLSGFNLHDAETGWGLFESAISLQRITLGSDWKWFEVDSYLPAPSSDNILGADGKWYSVTTGRGYAPADIPAGKADTYVASKELLPKVAFAVYSADDSSLDFYKRVLCDVPVAGSTFEGKTVTDVYTRIETEKYVNFDNDEYDNWYGHEPNTPWWPVRNAIRTVKIIDSGITPASIDYWFYQMENLSSIDVQKLDTSRCSDFFLTFGDCSSLTSIDVSNWSTQSLINLNGTFLGCVSMKSLNLGGWETSNVVSFHCLFHNCRAMSDSAMQTAIDQLEITENATNFNLMFEQCDKLNLDCSNWNVRADANHDRFNGGAPGIILPKAWQAGTFAVYSEDDGSLDFYKRSNCELPTAGDTFEGKTVTEVYTGIETTRYTPIDYNDPNGATNVPWYNHASDCKSVSVVDDGIKPIYLAFWFHRFKNCISFDVSKLDTSSASGIEHIFYNCENVRDLDLSTWDLSHCESAVSAFAYCYNLESIEFGSISTANFKPYGCYWMFSDCHKLSLDCSEWVIDSSAIQYAFNSGAPSVIPPKTWK